MKYTIIFTFLLSFSSLIAQEDYSLRPVAGGLFSLHFSKEYDSAVEPNLGGSYYFSPERVVDVQPYMAWKVGKNMLLGMRLGFRSELDKTIDMYGATEEEVKNIANTYSVGAFSRHFLSPEKAVRFFVEPYLSYARLITKQIDADEDEIDGISTKSYQGILSPGATFQLTPHFNLLMKFGQVGVRTGKVDYGQGTKNWYKEFIADFNLTSFAFGMEYRF